MSFGVVETVSQIPEASSQAQGAPMFAVGKVICGRTSACSATWYICWTPRLMMNRASFLCQVYLQSLMRVFHVIPEVLIAEDEPHNRLRIAAHLVKVQQRTSHLLKGG